MPPLSKPRILHQTGRNSKGRPLPSYVIYCGTKKVGNSVRPIRFYRSTLEAAQKKADEIAARSKVVGRLALLLDSEQTLDAAEAFRMLKEAGRNVSLAEITKRFLQENGDALSCGFTACEASDEFLASVDCGHNHKRALRRTLRRLFGEGAKDPLVSYRKQEFVAFLQKIEHPATRNLARAHILAFLNWCRKRDKYPMQMYLACKDIEASKVPYVPPCFFKPETVEAIMRWCESQTDADMLVPKMAIGFFAGIRTAEIHRMKWKDVKFATKEIRVEDPKGTAGTPPRVVTMSDNLYAWLIKYQLDGQYPVCYDEDDFSERRVEMCKELGIKWDAESNRNVARHTFAGAHVALHRDLFKTAHELGHFQGTDMLRSHYLSAYEACDAAKLFAIYPKGR